MHVGSLHVGPRYMRMTCPFPSPQSSCHDERPLTQTRARSWQDGPQQCPFYRFALIACGLDNKDNITSGRDEDNITSRRDVGEEIAGGQEDKEELLWVAQQRKRIYR